ncbi:MAG: ribosome biogenesis GTPase Der [Gammaproteobacteria bacterium]|nr:ribosome biogenesis GTPase Der [Gammaproteobacteria bacterium]MCI0591107.1 ribosome biogenesis GTPase Der [Gammaproteobacteria bacterium]
MKHIIAIVGRPNVGKSTLFNRLTGSRDALVAPEPGLTRDRQFGRGHFGDRSFLVVDTGGFTEGDESGESIAGLIARQTLQAVREADVTLLLVDGRAGLTVTDEVIARQLRPLGRPVQLVVNKAEGLEEDVASAEFHALGFRRPHAISARYGHRIHHLMETVLSMLPESVATGESDEDSVGESLRITVVGRPNVGKSTLINRILGEERVLTHKDPGTTRDSIAIPFERKGKHYTFIDTAGIRRRARVKDVIEKFSIIKSLQAIDTSHVVIIVLDAIAGIAVQDTKLLGLVLDSGKSLVIAVNKWDNLGRAKKNEMRDEIKRKLHFIEFAPVHYISALKGIGIGKLFAAIDRAGSSTFTQISTAKLTRLVHKAVESHPPPLVRGRRVKLRYAHLGGHNPLRVIVHGNQTEHVPEPYRRYLENTLREALGFEGTPVQVEFRRGENPFDKGPG